MPLDNPLRILTNTTWFDRQVPGECPTEATRFPHARFWPTIRALMRARGYGAVVINVDSRRLYVCCLFKRIVGLRQCRLVSVDIHLSPPRTIAERLRVRLVGRLLRQVDLFICYFTASEALARVYGLDPRRFAYVPFKVNSHDTVLATKTTDDGFALVCGRTNRDYRTLAMAVQDLDVPVVVLEYVGPDRAAYNVDVQDVSMPPNVTVVPHDGTGATWIEWLARARCVVIPVLPDVLTPSGISTYLMAMALGKCVVMTHSPGTTGLIDGGQALLVPAGDPMALRAAIEDAAMNPVNRKRIAATGKAYALSLGNSARLARDVLREVHALVHDTRTPVHAMASLMPRIREPDMVESGTDDAAISP